MRKKALDLGVITQSTQDRFWARVDRTGTCWLWTGKISSPAGYGRLRVNDREVFAHRVAYLMAGNQLDPDLVMDHLCRVRHCVNPDHLEQVTAGENLRRGLLSYAIRQLCKAGLHDITDPTNRTVTARTRTCRQCRLDSNARRRAKRRQAYFDEYGEWPKPGTGFKAECIHGHPLTAENRTARGECRVCTARQRAYTARRRAA